MLCQILTENSIAELIFDSKEKIIHPPNDPSFHEKNKVAYDKEKIDSS